MIDFDYKMPSGTHAGQSAMGRFYDQINIQGSIPTHNKELGNCWMWTGKLFRNGYGCFYYKGKYLLAHRVAWELETKEEPKLLVLHKCDNPSCVNFNHLFQGTTIDNVLDKISKGRENTPFGERVGNSKLSEEDVKNIRTKYSVGNIFMKELSKEYGVSQKQISVIISQKQWRRVDNI